MIAFRRLLPCLLFFPLATFAGCTAFSEDYWRSPSILTTAPPTPEKRGKHESQGGFSVVVEAPGQPTAARAIKDIVAFAQRRGFVRQATDAGGERYIFGNITLDVRFRAADSHVVALLHGPKLARKFADNFYRDFNQEYARQYGEENPIFESDYLNE